MTQLHHTLIVLFLLAFVGCAAKPIHPVFGEIERLDPALDAIIEPGTQMQLLAEGFTWSEGPVWLKADHAVIFSDVPENKIYRWKESEGLSVYLQPSGATRGDKHSSGSGSNGLLVDPQGRLLLCQHGDRRVAYMDTPLTEPKPKYLTVADRYNGKRFNSPNDLALHSSGSIYFTDPPYGLPGTFESSLKEQDAYGVYRISTDGTVTRLIEDATAPNGIAFSPDQKTLYLAQSDTKHPRLNAYTVADDGMLDDGRIFFDASELAKTRPGMPDGLKVDEKGNLFATGPGGVLIISPEGKHIGSLLTGRPTGNCCFGDDGRTLYITSDDVLLRIRLKTRGSIGNE